MVNSKRMLILGLLCHSLTVAAQFAPSAGVPGSEAIHGADGRIISWATSCSVQRGWQDIAEPELGLVSSGSNENALGPADGWSTVSLGDGGVATLSFLRPIIDGPGWDFVVFENSFNHSFLELAFVEVSEDGEEFFRFPAVSLTDTTKQIGAFGSLEATKINHLAGKYMGMWGTPFDLSDLPYPLDSISMVRVIDVIGSVDAAYGFRDSGGRLINDPYPTPFLSGGFDLDAVGVIHQKRRDTDGEFTVFPNPLNFEEALQINFPKELTDIEISIFDIAGRQVFSQQISKATEAKIWLSGNVKSNNFLILQIQAGSLFFVKKIVLKP